MTDRRALAVLGGDERQITMARMLCERGYRVFVWGLGACGERIGKAVLSDTWQDAIEQAEAVILPLPASVDGVRVHCPLEHTDMFLRVPALLESLGDRLLLGGRLSEAIRNAADDRGVSWIDFFDFEILQIRNALPTAEGAIAIAMRELPVTIDGITAVILGYGRIGSLLGEKLHALGAHVTVFARRAEQLALAGLRHLDAKPFVCMDGGYVPLGIPAECRVIFNTVPHWVLSEEILRQLPTDCVLIDLASAPGGYDHNLVKSLGLRSVWGTSLPGKCTPESAGAILAQTLEEILRENNLTS